MTDARCPKCHAELEETELGNGRRPAWWCDRCRLIVLEDQVVRIPIERERADLR